MNVEFGNDNRFKKRVSKSMMANFAADKGFAPSLGSTLPDAKGFDNLETALENVESAAQLVANQLERDEVLRLQDPTQFQAPAGVAKFYLTVKQAISALKKANFVGLPRTDIASLTSYFERLSAFDFDQKFKTLLLHFERAAPTTAAEVAAAAAADAQSALIIRNFQRSINRRKLHIQNLIGQLDVIVQEFTVLTVVPREDPATGLPWLPGEKPVLDPFLMPARRKLTDQMDALKYEVAGERDILAREEAGLKTLLSTKTTKSSRAGLVKKDMVLVIPAFKVLLDSLENGLQAYNSGISGKNILVGSGEYRVAMGGISYMPRRFM